MPNVIYRGTQPDGYYVGVTGVSRLYMGNVLVYPFGFLLSVEKGTFTLSGQPADLRKSQLGVASPGAYVLTGQAASKNIRVPFVAGAYTLNGIAANLYKSILMPADVGAYALTGRAVGPHYILTAAQGTYSVTGVAALKQQTGKADPGAYTLTGIDAVLRKSIIGPAAPGAYTVTGIDANLRRQVLAADAGTYTLQGQPANLLYGHLLFGQAGAFVISGVAAGLLKGSKLAADAGALALTGQNANLVYSFDANAYPIPYVLTGQAVNFARLIPSDVGAYALTGLDARKQMTMSTAPGALTLAGQAANFTYTPKTRSKAGSFLTGTGAAATTVAITGVGFQPKFVMFFWTGQTGTSDAVAGGNCQLGFGMATGPSNRGCQTNFIADAAATTAVDRGMRDDCCVANITSATAIDGRLDFQSFDSDGFTLVVDDAMTASMQIHYLCLGGSVLTNAELIRHVTSAATGNNDFTGYAFTPSALLAMSFGTNTAPPTTATGNANIGINMADSALKEISFRMLSTGAAAASSTLGLMAEDVWNQAATTHIGTMTAYLAAGFRVNWSVAPAVTSQVMTTAFAGSTSKCGVFQTRTDTNAITVTGLGFRPTAVIFLSAGRTDQTWNGTANTARISIGVCDSVLGQRAIGYKEVHAADPTQVGFGQEHDACLLHITDADGVDGIMAVTSLDSDGFTCQMSDPDPAARYVGYMAFG